MLLEALKTYADDLALEDQTPPMYERQRVRYVVDLDADGRFLNLIDWATGTTGPDARGRVLVGPKVARTVAIRPNLLMDNGEYALGLAREGSPPAKVHQRHAAFLEQVRQCAAATRAHQVAAVLRFLELSGKDPPYFSDPVRPLDTFTFRVGGTLPIDLPEVRAYWARASGADATKSAAEGQAGAGYVLACLLCGQQRPVLRRIPFKHKNVPGGQTSGTALISANSNAFESYGLRESLIAPVCHECAEAFSKGLNALIAGPSTHLRRDPLLYVFWSRQGGFAPLSFLETAEPDEVRELLRVTETARTGSLVALSAERFYAVSLAGSGGRLAVRDWLDMTVGEVQLNLARFFRLQQLADLYGPDLVRPLPVWRLAKATVRDVRRDDPQPGIARSLYRAALAGGPVPLDVLFGVIRRFRAEQHVSPERAALVKLVLLSHEDSSWREDQMVSLDRAEHHPAYLCGRLLAVLEDAQRQALGDPGAPLSTASTGPPRVPRLRCSAA